jgi:putative membrane protein
VKGLRYGLERHRSAMIYFILGMMLGSFYAIVMGPTAISNPVAPLSLRRFGFVFFVAGGIIILGLQALKGVFEKKEHND